ncbi:MAG: 1-(5-phosphoribosyl)-5-[(5-phosphoribosylamino)methylideneamino]imidazole-4-carboxamide isomerase [Rivularia sp. T60_A2020_040]|nr:1-(5-phosphoribosyl)-5-[(5-phosphoribosylamino)methylideneamino]imidazole-4-carboxamide isomerase [Rivularia sp. T60_A2020_040]
MQVIPAIDLLENRCVRLYQGDYQKSEVFSENPADIAKKWVEQGATRLHVVDLDGAKAGKVVNLSAIENIVNAVSVPVEVGGGLRSRESVQQLFNIGVQWAILGTVAVEQPQLVQELAQEFTKKIIVGIDARNGKVATRGWLETSEVLATQLAIQMQELGAAEIIYTDIQRDGTLSGPNLDALRELAAVVDIPIIASGGISSVTDLLSLLALEPQGVTGAIVGRALYTEDISLREAVRAVGLGRIQDIPPHGFSTFA